MNRLRNVILCVCVCALIASTSAVVRADVEISIMQVPPTPGVPLVWMDEWNEWNTAGGAPAWLFEAGEDIAGLHIGTWDDDEYVTPGFTSPLFDLSYSACTDLDPGGPPVPGVPEQPYWQTLDLWGGTGLVSGHTYQINISHVPQLDGVPQNTWVHTTPEPSVFWLLGLGGLVALRRR